MSGLTGSSILPGLRLCNMGILAGPISPVWFFAHTRRLSFASIQWPFTVGLSAMTCPNRPTLCYHFKLSISRLSNMSGLAGPGVLAGLQLRNMGILTGPISTVWFYPYSSTIVR